MDKEKKSIVMKADYQRVKRIFDEINYVSYFDRHKIVFLQYRFYLCMEEFGTMQDIEPFYNWRHIYVSEEDQLSPFFGRQYSEFEFTQTVYNYYIHPQWDDFGSRTLIPESVAGRL